MSNRIKFSSRLIEILNKLEENGDYVAYELNYMSDDSSNYFNGLNITNVDIGNDYSFLVTIDGKQIQMKIGKFLRYYFRDILTNNDINKFTNSYNRAKGGKRIQTFGKKIEVSEFSFNPMDPRSTFLSLTTKTYPHGHEEEVLQFLPDLEKDKFGNYYTIVGDNKQPSVMFTSHLDTADRKQVDTSLYTRELDGDEIIYTDGTTILGADDKSGVTVMLYMMVHKIPGLYYFFIGEERGGIGSNKLSADFENNDYLKNVKKCISFDRRKTNSVITSQLGRVCCSNKFATALCEEYNKSGLNLSLDPTGIYTDSASFIDEIPECTNISVGYENEHTGRELQNMSFLIRLCEASLKVNWDSLPVDRKVGVNQELLKKHKYLIDEIKKAAFDLEVKIVGYDGSIYIRIDIEDSDIESIYNTLAQIDFLLNKYRIDDEVIIDDTYIKIELR